MKSETRILIGLIIFFIVFTGLAIAIYYNGKDADCNQCLISFKTFEQGGRKLQNPIIIDKQALHLYDSFLDGRCEVKWDRVQGYYENF